MTLARRTAQGVAVLGVILGVGMAFGYAGTKAWLGAAGG